MNWRDEFDRVANADIQAAVENPEEWLRENIEHFSDEDIEWKGSLTTIKYRIVQECANKGDELAVVCDELMNLAANNIQSRPRHLDDWIPFAVNYISNIFCAERGYPRFRPSSYHLDDILGEAEEIIKIKPSPHCARLLVLIGQD